MAKRESVQKKLQRIRPPRVQLTYDVEVGDAKEIKELPFVVGVLGDFTNWTLKRNPDVYYPDPYQGFELLSPYICAISAKSSTFDANGNETTTDYQRMFSILKNAPDFMFAGVEFFGNELSRNLGAKKTRELIEKVLAL